MWLSTHSIAASTPELFVALHAFFAPFSSKPIATIWAMMSASGLKRDAPPAGCAVAASSSSTYGVWKSASPMWLSTHSIAASTPELFVALHAFFAPFSSKPIATIWAMMSASGLKRVDAGAAPLPSGASGMGTSPSRMPWARSDSRFSSAGASTSTSSFAGRQFLSK